MKQLLSRYGETVRRGVERLICLCDTRRRDELILILMMKILIVGVVIQNERIVFVFFFNFNKNRYFNKKKRIELLSL